MKELCSRMELLKFKIETVIEFINILTELDFDTSYVGHCFENKACLDILNRWEKLCGRYRTYFLKP